mgnify:CR=1 FL=1
MIRKLLAMCGNANIISIFYGVCPVGLCGCNPVGAVRLCRCCTQILSPNTSIAYDRKALGCQSMHLCTPQCMPMPILLGHLSASPRGFPICQRKCNIIGSRYGVCGYDGEQFLNCVIVYDLCRFGLANYEP